MKKLNNKSGFTLIEIIVVLIIVGVLAAIALPNLFQNVTRSQSAEAIAALGALKSQQEGCVMTHVGTEGTSCAGIGAAGAWSNTANFSYKDGVAPANAGGGVIAGGNYTIVATSTGNANNTVTLTKNSGTGAFSCAGAGAYIGVC